MGRFRSVDMDPRPDLCVVEIGRGLGGFPAGLRFKSGLL